MSRDGYGDFCAHARMLKGTYDRDASIIVEKSLQGTYAATHSALLYATIGNAVDDHVVTVYPTIAGDEGFGDSLATPEVA